MSHILLIVFIVLLLAWARKAKPAGNKTGHGLLDSDQVHFKTENDTLRVATFNIQTGKSNESERDINTSANALKEVDLAGIQEVYAPSLLNLLGLGYQQSQHLAKRGGFAWLFCATRRRWLREHRGNALLSKLKVLDWQIQMLPDQSGKSYRNMTTAKVEWQGQHFHFINTHLHTRQGRADQLQVVLQEFANYPRAILVGDFNSRSDMPELADALKNIEITDAINVANLDLGNPNRIDWILTKGFKIEGGKMLEKGISDHPYYEVSLSYQS